MTPAHIHLVLNHAPAFALAFGMLVMLYGLKRKSADAARAGMWLLVLAALTALPTFFSGEEAERIVKGLPAVDAAGIEPHEEAGTLALWSCIVTGLAALVVLWFSRRRSELPRKFVLGLILLGVISGGILTWTGNLGGKISHPELRAGFVAPAGHESEGEED